MRTGEPALGPAPIGHNGGPPLERHRPPWGDGAIGGYFAWRSAHRRRHRTPPRAILLRRLEAARAVGLTYEEYAREIAERGRHLSAADGERIAAIVRARTAFSVPRT
ncbi:hypothetical protein [Acuticoccus sp.]|uniref:hypothetical protein n=1 Tax=Acuticoccus sp. TaxID=1904378 RepID=UPI003B52E9A0